MNEQKQNGFNRLIEPKQQIPEERKRFTNQGLWRLILPIIIEQFLALLVGITDTLMISHAGEAAVSAVSLDNQLNNVFIMVFSALASGGAVVASQYVGYKDREKGSLAAGQLVMITTVISVVLTTFVLFAGRRLFSLLFGSVEPDVLDSGLIYLRISAYSFPFLAIYNGCAGLYRSMGKTRTIMNVSLIMNAINVAGNAIGVFVLHAGVAGVAYPSLLSRIFAAVVMFLLCLNEKNEIYISFQNIFTWNISMLKRIFGIAVPNGIENGLFQVAKVSLSSLVAMFGTVQIAANGVAQSFWSMAALSAIAMQPAFITVIGQYMGAGDPEGAEYYLKKLIRITWVFGAVWNIGFFAVTPLLLKLYSLSDEAVRLVMILVIIHNTFNAVFAPMAFSVASGMRAAGDVKYTMYASLLSTVVCRVALSYLFGLVFNLGVIGVTLAMACDWMIHAVMIIFRWKSGKWKTFHVI